ncbi:nuclear condensing complex subunit [Sporodiniella umbellata]|nr:nuclear condensing complex subunit [Sporodiniella umbellata]
MGEIDEDLYQDLKIALFERIKDKDASVRVQAATALCRLQSADNDIDPTDGKTILQKLMWVLQNDASAARDVDAINRRVVYLKPLTDIQDFRLLSFEQRTNVLRWGLNDRDPLVRKAVAKMLSTKWIQQASNNLIEFLERLEILSPGVADVAETVLNAFFAERMDIISEITFDGEFWKHLTPESIFLAKVFIKFLQTSNHLDERLEEVLPEVTEHAINLEHYWEMHQSASDEDKVEYEFIISQFLDTCMCLDYADEVGRRKMFELLRSILKSFDILEDHLTKIISLFRIISSDERDFTRTMIEIISDIQEQLNPFELLEESSTKKVRLDDDASSEKSNTVAEPVDNDIRIKCLSICRSMLENSQESFTKNSNLYGLLNDLIVPAVQNSDTVLREIGLHCLGLCCTLDKELAQHNTALFMHCIKCGHDDLKIRALMILFDLLMTYGLQTVTSHLESPDEMKEVLEYCLDDNNDEVQAIAAEGVSKLMLTQRLNDESLLRLLVLLYFLPVTEDMNLKVQQCLSYFFPAYSFSSLENQKNMTAVAISVLNEVCTMHSDLKPYEKMSTPLQISDMLADWTDPRKLARLHIENLYDETDMSAPGSLAVQALQAALESEGYKRKTLLHFVLKLYLDKVKKPQLLEIKDLINRINTEQPIKETMTRNAYSILLAKVEENLSIE